MFELKTLQNLNAYFDPLSARGGHGVYFYRISCYNAEIDAFIRRYFQEARQTGIVVEGRIPNPDERNLAYYEEIMGSHFQMNLGFFADRLKKWLPRMGMPQGQQVATAMYDILDSMRREGKNENILKNAYIKFMCWLYYKFERIVHLLGGEQLPKILYEGSIGLYELRLLAILSKAGCDVVLLQCAGEEAYLKADPNTIFSKVYSCAQAGEFPEGFGIAQIRKDAERQRKEQQLYGADPLLIGCTNAWITGDGLADLLTAPSERGKDKHLFYNCFIRLCGVSDKLTYTNELFQFQHTLKESKRKTVILEGQIPPPTMEEIAAIRRKNYTDLDQMLLDLSANIQYTANVALQRLMVKSFVAVMTQDRETAGDTLNKRLNQAVYLLSWLKRYQSALFSGWKDSDISCFIYLGGCNHKNEALFLQFLAGLPVDVLVLSPDLANLCCLSDPLLYEKRYNESLALTHFPTEEAEIQMGTAAFQAEQELNTILYQDSGLYRNQQYQRAISVTLQTTYEEIAILWDEELKYRPNFSVVGSAVTLPVIFAKASGVKDGHVAPYWSSIKRLETEDALLVRNPPCFQLDEPNPQKAYVTEFLKNGRLQKEKIRSHRAYPYGFLREDMQEHILDKLQLLLEQRLIKGTFENGMEYTIIATVLHLPKEILRLLQKFDFTKKNPKLIYINTLEQAIPPEDAIIAAFLNLAGFDVLFFIPTGYQTVEFHFAKKVMQEHQIGAYQYDLQPPNFQSIASGARPNWRERLFGKG